jgi:3-oxoacyl-ACP reductase-like protein
MVPAPKSHRRRLLSIFGSIMDKIFHHASAAPAEAPADSAAPAPAAEAGGAAAPSVDVGAVLSQMASQKGGGGNYQISIVDLLKLLDLDSSLDARKQLGQELGVHAGADGSAEQNIALHKAVVQKLAENGGKVPDSMKG